MRQPGSATSMCGRWPRAAGANKDRIVELLETLASLGKARQPDDGRYEPV